MVVIIEPNKNLGLLKAHHFVLGYEKRFTENLMGKLRYTTSTFTIYQSKTTIPVIMPLLTKASIINMLNWLIKAAVKTMVWKFPSNGFLIKISTFY